MPSSVLGVLPGRLQASYLLEAERFAWWGTSDPAGDAAALGLPPGERREVRFALPDRDRATVCATDVPAALVPTRAALDALVAMNPTANAGRSLRAWAGLASVIRTGEQPSAALVEGLPTAGHAALGLDGTTIWSAGAVVEAVLRHASASGSDSVVLRPYQQAGVAWLLASESDGGGVLADEMGLGKTLQAITVLRARPSAGPHLVVCPTSVLGNWRREFARFAPALPVRTYVGATRRSADLRGVVLTSYGVLRSDAALRATTWDVVVLDEAQQIKNPDAQAARAARALDARLRLAMTGTPVENRLDELWSLLAFTNPGLLGTRSRFRQRFSVAVEQRRSAAAAERLHELVGPHVLRRRKVDVAPELPAKIETTVVCALTAEQEALYRASIDEAFTAGLGSGVGRRGRVLALLGRLKQICNHPELLEPTGGELRGRSGKLDRITEILAEVVDNGDRALVFTQYRATGDLLARHLQEHVTGTPVPFLHGQLSSAARERTTTEFTDDPDGPPVLILSLRAAGFGLNLTRATHVVHYDRWWNPAVEAQASDRAHRIGQTRTVTVHTLITERSIEEAVADLHAGKRDLAGVAAGELPAVKTDLARLGDEQLRALLAEGVAR
ncbi:DEAD/DEAH box helicase [Umezawaea beigongshangensis]|uniref:DEAD/DEAH box helicase n=1 Tax=Umezawaea beigongshangensis TaxID=2780383 RepID=UPI001E30163E|nr:DEAD/DEAH box helicase [Umezawaea beigongshangensis]